MPGRGAAGAWRLQSPLGSQDDSLFHFLGKARKVSRCFMVDSKQTPNPPIAWPKKTPVCALGPARRLPAYKLWPFDLLENSSWGVRSGNPRGPRHTHRVFTLIEAFGGPQRPQGKADCLVGCDQGQLRASSPFWGSCLHPYREDAGRWTPQMWLTPPAPLGGSPCAVNPQPAQTFLPLSSGPELFQQHPHLGVGQIALGRRAGGARTAPGGTGREPKDSLQPVFLQEPRGRAARGDGPRWARALEDERHGGQVLKRA